MTGRLMTGRLTPLRPLEPLEPLGPLAPPERMVREQSRPLRMDAVALMNASQLWQMQEQGQQGQQKPEALEALEVQAQARVLAHVPVRQVLASARGVWGCGWR
jgi:hypothetical protein